MDSELQKKMDIYANKIRTFIAVEGENMLFVKDDGMCFMEGMIGRHLKEFWAKSGILQNERIAHTSIPKLIATKTYDMYQDKSRRHGSNRTSHPWQRGWSFCCDDSLVTDYFSKRRREEESHDQGDDQGSGVLTNITRGTGETGKITLSDSEKVTLRTVFKADIDSNKRLSEHMIRTKISDESVPLR